MLIEAVRASTTKLDTLTLATRKVMLAAAIDPASGIATGIATSEKGVS